MSAIRSFIFFNIKYEYNITLSGPLVGLITALCTDITKCFGKVKSIPSLTIDLKP